MIAEQVEAGVVVRMAVLYELLAGRAERARADRASRRPHEREPPASSPARALVQRAGAAAPTC